MPRSFLRRLLRRARQRPWRAVGLLAGATCLALNALAYRHAGAFVNYRPGASSPAPEALGAWERAAALVGGVAVARPENLRDPSAVGLAFTSHTLPGSPRLEVWRVPHPAARGVVLLVPGYAASKASLLEPAARLHALGQTCVLLDVRGVGGSEGASTTLGVREAEDVVRAAAWAREPGLPLTILGSSQGAAAALRAAAHHGLTPDALVLEAPFARLLDAVRARFALLGVPAFPCAELLVVWGGVRAGIDGFAHAPEDDAGAVACPTLVLAGAQDRRAPLAGVERVAAAIPGGARLRVLEGSHAAFSEARSEAWVQAVGELLDAVTPPATRSAPPPGAGPSPR